MVDKAQLTNFITLASDAFMRLDLELVKFEESPRDAAVLAKIGAIMQTVERAAYHFGFDTLGASAKKVIKLCEKKTDLPKLLQAIDQVRDTLDLIEHVGTDIAVKKPKIIKLASAPAPANTPEPVATPVIKSETDSEISGNALNAIRDHILGIVSASPNNIFVPDVPVTVMPVPMSSSRTRGSRDISPEISASLETTKEKVENDNKQKRVLLVEDSPYFRDTIVPFLCQQGFTVTCVATAAEALALRASGQQFDIILSDNDLPDMNTTSFILKARADNDNAWSKTPIITLTTANSNDANSASKLEHDSLLKKIQKNLA